MNENREIFYGSLGRKYVLAVSLSLKAAESEESDEKFYEKCTFPGCENGRVVVDRPDDFGTFAVPDKWEHCPLCRGKGKVMRDEPPPIPRVIFEKVREALKTIEKSAWEIEENMKPFDPTI